MFRRQEQAYKGKGAGSSAAYDGAYTTELFAATDLIGTTVNEGLVTAIPNKRIRVLSCSFSSTAVGSGLRFKSGAGAGTNISDMVNLAANSNFSQSDSNGICETEVGERLGIQHTAAGGVRITYIVVE